MFNSPLALFYSLRSKPFTASRKNVSPARFCQMSQFYLIESFLRRKISYPEKSIPNPIHPLIAARCYIHPLMVYLLFLNFVPRPSLFSREPKFHQTFFLCLTHHGRDPQGGGGACLGRHTGRQWQTLSTDPPQPPLCRLSALPAATLQWSQNIEI